MGSSPVRMLWISIRAMQYTDRATQQVVGNMSKLMAAEDKMHRQHAILSIAGGVMWVALASMATSAVMGIMRTTREGAGVMNQFDRSVGQLTKSFGTAFVKVLGPVIKALTGLFTWISKLPMPVLTAMAAIVTCGLAFLTFFGVSMILRGGLTYLGIKLFHTSVGFKQLQFSAGPATAALNNMSIAGHNLGLSLNKAFLIFTVFMSLGSMLGKEGSKWAAVIGGITLAVLLLAKALWGAAIPTAIVTGGLAMAGGLAAAALMQQTFQVGTRRVQRTGPAIVHAGEMVGTERGLKAQIGGKGAGSPDKQQINATINFSGNIQTKADKEELRPLILKVIKEALDNKA
jgi:hypothetical protein